MMIIYCILYTLIFLIGEISLLETCQYSVSCVDSQTNCAVKTKSDSSNVFYLSLRECNPLLHHIFCDVYQTLVSPDTLISSCQYYPYTMASYTGGTCQRNKTDVECIFGHCLEGICVNSYDGVTCDNHEDCPLNKACINEKCQNYIQENNDTCNNSYECPFNYICVNSFCIRMYSYDNGVDITNEISSVENPSLLCKSGGYYKKKEGSEEKYYSSRLSSRKRRRKRS